MTSISKYKIILLVSLVFSVLDGFSQSIAYKDLSGIWQIKQNNNWVKHMSLDLISKYHECSWTQIVNEKDSISLTTYGTFKLSKRDKEYIVSLNTKALIDESGAIPKTIRFLIRKNNKESFSI